MEDKRKYRKWKQSEVKFMLEHRGVLTNMEIAQAIGVDVPLVKSMMAYISRYYKLPKLRNRYTPTDYKMIYEHWSSQRTISENCEVIARYIPHTARSIHSHLRQNGGFPESRCDNNYKKKQHRRYI